MFEFLNKTGAIRGVYRLSNMPAHDEAMRLYLEARRIEGRLYSDDVVKSLPAVGAGHLYEREWHVRSASCRKLLDYISRKPTPMRVLDLGCGNGWLSNRMAQDAGCFVTGVDMNLPELEQGARVFHASERLRFVYADIFQDVLPASGFDLITISAAIQYFPSLKGLIERLLPLLSEGKAPEIHIIDSPIYRKSELAGARDRSRAHYASIGVPEMADFYHHHSFDDLASFHYTIRYDPSSIPNRIRRLFTASRSPFPWILITKS